MKNAYWSSVTYPLHIRLSWNRNFIDRFSKNTQISNFTKNTPIGSRAVPCRIMDGYDEANSSFPSFPKCTYNTRDAGRWYVSIHFGLREVQHKKICCQKLGVQVGQSPFTKKVFPEGKSVLDMYCPQVPIT